jgi:hypothetical protein
VPTAIAWLRDNPHGTVRVVVGPDDICLPCPHWQGGTCGRGFEELNCGKDRAFLQMLGLDDGDGMPAQRLMDLFRDRASAEFFRATCPNCSPDRCAQATRSGVSLGDSTAS